MNSSNNAVYASKAWNKKAAQIHGSVGWREAPTGLEEVIFFELNGDPGSWLPVLEYQKRVAAIKAHNIKYYEENPGELTKKIRRREDDEFPRLLRTSRPHPHVYEGGVAEVGSSCCASRP